MKLILVGILCLVAGFNLARFNFGDRQYTVVMKFESGNTLALSEAYGSHSKCINSDEYIVHTAFSEKSGAKIQCTNKKPTYK